MAHAHPLTDGLKRREDVLLTEVTPDNRDRLADEIVQTVRRSLQPCPP